MAVILSDKSMLRIDRRRLMSLSGGFFRFPSERSIR